MGFAKRISIRYVKLDTLLIICLDVQNVQMSVLNARLWLCANSVLKATKSEIIYVGPYVEMED